MKKFFKLIGIIAFVAVIGLSMSACEEEDVHEISGTAVAVYSGVDGMAVVTFIYSGNEPCTVTTNMDAPNDSFILDTQSDRGARICGGLTEGQTVTWTAKVDSGNLSADVKSGEVFIKNHVKYN